VQKCRPIPTAPLEEFAPQTFTAKGRERTPISPCVAAPMFPSPASHRAVIDTFRASVVDKASEIVQSNRHAVIACRSGRWNRKRFLSVTFAAGLLWSRHVSLPAPAYSYTRFVVSPEALWEPWETTPFQPKIKDYYGQSQLFRFAVQHKVIQSVQHLHNKCAVYFIASKDQRMRIRVDLHRQPNPSQELQSVTCHMGIIVLSATGKRAPP